MKQEEEKVFHLTIEFPEVERFDWNPEQSNVIAHQLFLKHYVLWAYKKKPISEEQWHVAPKPCQGLGEQDHFKKKNKSKGIFIALSFSKLNAEQRDSLLSLDEVGTLYSNLTYQTLADELTASEPDKFFVINPIINEINTVVGFAPEERKHSLPKPSDDETEFYSNLYAFAQTFETLLTVRDCARTSKDEGNGKEKNEKRPKTPQPTEKKKLTTLIWLTKLLKKFMKKCYRLVAQFLGKKKSDQYHPAERQKLAELVAELKTTYNDKLKPKEGFIDLVKELHCIKKDKKRKTDHQSSIKEDTHKLLAKIALLNINDPTSGHFILQTLKKFIPYEISRDHCSERIEDDLSVYEDYEYYSQNSKTPAPTPERTAAVAPPSPPPLRELLRGIPPKSFLDSFGTNLKTEETQSSDSAPTLRLGEYAKL